ncbi:DRTGG domain-containing protein [Labilibaculum sp.]|uniref:DRTGG domain-containing protein n=1 Tax=Labilibaculum sp. TaxID=2060723 RepID=UPI003564BB9B
MVKLADVVDKLNARVICGNGDVNREIHFGFASDLMSDVLTLDADNLLLITGLNNLQTIRTSEMSDISFILFVRDKKVSKEMKELACENNMTLLECSFSMFKACSVLGSIGLKPVY